MHGWVDTKYILLLFSSPYGYSPSSQTPPQEEPPMNNILLYTIFNPIYPITVVSWMMELLSSLYCYGFDISGVFIFW